MSLRPFRFGVQVSVTTSDELRAKAVAAEAAGFDVISSFDHFGEVFSALVPLAFAAAWTSRIRLCPLVLNNDFHHPATLAQELATLDRLSEGRLEVGIGAGHSFTEYAAIGLAFDPPAARKRRLAESVEIIRRLLDGDEVTLDGDHYQLEAARSLTAGQAHLPILVGVNGQSALGHAARHADIIGLTMLGRTLEDGQHHEVRWEPERIDATVAHIRQIAGDRWAALELNALVQVVRVTDDREGALAEIAADFPDLATGLGEVPFVAVGTPDEIARHLIACRERYNISYYSVRAIEEFAPVIERLRSLDEGS